MKLKHFVVYRVLRIAFVMVCVFPRYWFLLAREYIGRPAPQSSWDRVHKAAAEHIRSLALALEGMLIKVAQVCGARADLFPKPFIDTLSRFHDDVPPRPWPSLIPLIEAELGAPLISFFASVDSQPLGAASLAQVHRARLHDGSDVVIKIQYPEARHIFPADFAMVRWVAALVQRMQSRIDIRALIEEVTRFIGMELDFRREAYYTERLGQLLSSRTNVQAPRVYKTYTRDRVLVLEYLDGIQITQIDALRTAGHEPGDVARRVGDIYGAMLFEYGVFHSDPHPGNLLVLADGRIGLLDYGLCKELPVGFANHLVNMMVSALIGDGEAALRAARDLGFDMGEIRTEHLRSLALGIMGDSDGVNSLATILLSSHIRRIPEDFTLVLRTMALLNGLSHRLAPGRRLIQGELLKHLAAGAAKTQSPLPTVDNCGAPMIADLKPVALTT